MEGVVADFVLICMSVTVSQAAGLTSRSFIGWRFSVWQVTNNHRPAQPSDVIAAAYTETQQLLFKYSFQRRIMANSALVM